MSAKWQFWKAQWKPVLKFRFSSLDMRRGDLAGEGRGDSMKNTC